MKNLIHFILAFVFVFTNIYPQNLLATDSNIVIDFIGDAEAEQSIYKLIDEEISSDNEQASSGRRGPISVDAVANGEYENNRFVSNKDETGRAGLTSKEIDALNDKKITEMSEKAAKESQNLDQKFNDSVEQIKNHLPNQSQNNDEKIQPGDFDVTGHIDDQQPLKDELTQYLNETEQDQMNQYYDLDFRNHENLVFKSDLGLELNRYKNRLDHANVKNSYRQSFKNEAYKQLSRADQYQIKGQHESAEAAFEVAKFLTDLATDFIAPVSIAKDLIRLFSGIDPMSGDKIGSLERGLAFAGIVLAATTLGMGSGIKSAIQKTFFKSEKVIGVVEKDFQLGKRIGAIVESKYPKAQITHTGTHKGTIIIGRDMNMVRDAHKSLSEANIETRIFDGDVEVGREVISKWEKMKINYSKTPTRRIPDEIVVRDAEIYKVDESWIKDRLKEGFNVLDLGSYTDKQSVFYEMEKRVVKEFQIGNIKP